MEAFQCLLNDVVKIAGCELWLKIVAKFHKTKTFYLVGSKPEVIEEVISKLKIEFQNINIAGYRDGYVKTDEEKEQLIEDIANKKPDVVFVAMGSPKQELLMKEMQKVHSNAIYQGLGGSFDVYTGRLKRAPILFVKLGIEGPYRIVTDLSVLRIKRFINDFKFIIKVWLRQYK